MPVGFDCGFELEKSRQLLICMHNKASTLLRSAATTYRESSRLPELQFPSPTFRKYDRLVDASEFKPQPDNAQWVAPGQAA